MTNDVFEAEQKHYVTLWMQSEWESGEPIITEPDKFVEQGWFDLETLPSPLFLPWKQLLRNENAIRELSDRLRATKDRN